MQEVRITLPVELLEAADVNPADASRDAAMLLALELYRENRISLGRAAELCQTSVEAFIVFAGRHQVSLHYGSVELEQDRCSLERLNL